MKTVKVTGAQHKVLQILSHKDISAIQRNPKLVAGAKRLLLACKKTIKKVEEIPQYTSRKKRETVYRRIVALCRKAIDEVGRKLVFPEAAGLVADFRSAMRSRSCHATALASRRIPTLGFEGRTLFGKASAVRPAAPALSARHTER